MTFCGKIRYSEPQHASDYMRYLKSQGTLRKCTTVYWCDACEAWHFGRIPKDAFKALQAIRLHTREQRACPTASDIMIATGLSYTKMQEAILVLKAYGWLRYESNDEKLILSLKHIPREDVWTEERSSSN